MKKKIIIGIVILVVLVLGFIFRSYLGFRTTPSVEPGNVVVNPPPAPVPATTTSPGTILPTPLPAPTPISKYPPYTGRDPKEVRPVPEEVKLFTEDQKRRLYAEIENYGDAVKKDPDFFTGWLQGGLVKKVIGDFEGARDMWEYASVIRPGNSTSFANLGELYWRYIPNFPKSEQNFQTALKNKPDDIGTYISLSELYFYSYKVKSDSADDVLIDALSKNKDNINLIKALAALFERQGNVAQALGWWKKAAVLEPSNTSIAATITALESKIK